MMAFYLVKGKFGGGVLRPEGMLIFASILIIQTVWALSYRLMRVARMTDTPVGFNKRNKKYLFPGDCDRMLNLLNGEGFIASRDATNCTVGCHSLSKGYRRALILETLSYSILLSVLVLGIINYGTNISGFVSIAAGGEWVDVGRNLQRIQKGFLVDRSDISLKIRGKKLLFGTADKPSEITFDLLHNGGDTPERITMHPGDELSRGKFRMLYKGDIYRAFISVRKGEQDLLPAPLKLFKQADTDDPMLYHGNLYFVTPGAAGQGWFDPETREFRVKIYLNNELGFDRSFAYGDQATEGDFLVGVTALAHHGRIYIWGVYYKNILFAGLILLFLCVVVRAVFNPQKILIWTEGDRTFFYTRNRRLKKKLSAESN